MRLPSPLRRVLTGALATAVAGALAAVLLLSHVITLPGGATLAASNNPPTPGNFTGYGFDQCQAPSQSAMNAWLSTSPYLAVGIYISGDDRYCLHQTYLNSAWVSTQLAQGWHLLPITLGPQASCNPRYASKERINPTAGKGNYPEAIAQGIAEANKTVAAAQSLGLVRGSTMYYDLEAFTYGNTACRVSALHFLSAWTEQLHRLGYLSGVYASGTSGIKALDVARRTQPGKYALPDQLWIADWNGVANTSSSYVSATGWMPDARLKQYVGGHVEKHGGVKIDIDDDFVDVGHGTVAPAPTHNCGTTSIDQTAYPKVSFSGGAAPSVTTVKVLKCLLHGLGGFHGKIRRGLGASLVSAARLFEKLHHLGSGAAFTKRAWVELLADGSHGIVKYGSGSEDVRALQRSLNAAEHDRLPVTGVFAAQTTMDLKAYQKKVGLPQTGVADATTWSYLRTGRI